MDDVTLAENWAGLARRTRSIALAILLVVLAASRASAIDWAGEMRLSDQSPYAAEIVATGPASALVKWQEGSELYVARTTDAGRTWASRRTITTDLSLGSGIAALGSVVDVVYARTVRCPTSGDKVSRVYYRRSLDGGTTWQAARALTSSCSQGVEPDVARSADGTVSIVWTGLFTGRLFVRTSRDGGATFGQARFIGSTTNSDFDTSRASTPAFSATPSIAFGDRGTAYVAYTSGRERISLRRSADRGLTWSAPKLLTTGARSRNVSLVAVGRRAFRAVYRVTDDRGLTWSAPHSVIRLTQAEFSIDPVFAYRDGLLALIVKSGVPSGSPIWQRESPDFGATWSTPTPVSGVHFSFTDPLAGGVAILGGVVLAGYGEVGAPGNQGLWVRRGIE